MNIIATTTVHKNTRIVPTTISITQSTTRTVSPLSLTTTSTTTTLSKTITRTTTTTTTYYAACATNNLISRGPDGATITEVYNNGLGFTSSYDVAPGSYSNPYDCCVACQQSNSCTGSVFRTGQSFCLLLRRKDRQCGSQCESEGVYTTNPNNREAGLVVSNGRCGYLKYGGNTRRGVPMVGSGAVAKARSEGL